MPAAFLVGIVASLLGREPTAEDMFDDEKLRTYLGVGAAVAAGSCGCSLLSLLPAAPLRELLAALAAPLANRNYRWSGRNSTAIAVRGLGAGSIWRQVT